MRKPTSLPRGRHEIAYKFCHVHCMHSANIIASAIIIAYEKVAWRPAIAPRFGETPETYIVHQPCLIQLARHGTYEHTQDGIEMQILGTKKPCRVWSLSGQI